MEFILVGGLAGNVHGSARATYDIDIVYRRSAENLLRLVRALEDQLGSTVAVRSLSV